MDYKKLKPEDIEKMSNNDLLKMNNEIVEIFEKNKKVLVELLDTQDMLEGLNEFVILTLDKRMNPQNYK